MQYSCNIVQNATLMVAVKIQISDFSRQVPTTDYGTCVSILCTTCLLYARILVGLGYTYV